VSGVAYFLHAAEVQLFELNAAIQLKYSLTELLVEQLIAFFYSSVGASVRRCLSS